MASIFTLNARTNTQLTPPQRPARAASELAHDGREALLAHDYAGAESAFAALSCDADPRHAHDGRVGLAMVELSTLAPQTAPAPEAPRHTPALRRAPSSIASSDFDVAEMVDALTSPSGSGSSTPRSVTGSAASSPAAAPEVEGERVPRRPSVRRGESAIPGAYEGVTVENDDASDEAASAQNDHPRAPADAARFDRAVATLVSRPFADPSELARLGAARAALHLGRPDDAWRALAGAPDSPEALLGRAASQFGLGAPQRARDILWPAVRPFAGGPRLGASGTAAVPGTYANLPAATRAALQAAYIAVDAAVGDNDPRYSAKDLGTHVRRFAQNSYAAAALDVAEAPGEAKEAAWRALCDRWPRSAEAAMLGVRFGFVTVDARRALLRERPGDALLQRATLVGALGAEEWGDALEATEALWRIRKTLELAGLAVRLGSLTEQSGAWMSERAAWTIKLSDAQPQAVLRQAHARIAEGGVDETLVDKMRRLAVGGQPEALVSLAQALKLQGRHDEALATLDVFLQPANATSGLFGAALLMRAKHRLYEQGRVVLDHDAACAEVCLAHNDLQRIGPQDAA